MGELIQELDLARWVTLREWVSTDELAGLYATATALIDSTKATGFSLPTLEAMSIGLPVLMADTEIFREVGADAVDFFAPGDPSDLARAAMDLVDDAPHRVELRRRGLERAASFSWERVATETLESFRAALAAR